MTQHDAHVAIWRLHRLVQNFSEPPFKCGVQPDPVAAKMVSDVAVLLERYDDYFFDY